MISILSTSIFTRDLMTRCPDLRIVSIWAAGVNNVDLDAARELGVTICNTPGYGNIGVGEHTLALMLAAARNMHNVDRRIRRGEWVKEPLVQLHGKTLGVLGAGPIAQRVMELGRLIGMDVIAWTLNPTPERAAKVRRRVCRRRHPLPEGRRPSRHYRPLRQDPPRHRAQAARNDEI